jgi:hypothetical protein
VEAVGDSSFLISLARAGLLALLRRLPFELVWLEAVKRETIDAGLAGGHPDAAAIESATRGLLVRPTGPAPAASVDVIVVDAAVRAGLLVSNDLALGRRARNLGAHWLRTADVVVLLNETGGIDKGEARAAIAALRDATRISPDLAGAYLDRIGGR